MSVVKMATVDCPHSNPLWFWLITQQAAIRYSIILLFLSNSIFLSRIWVCIKGSWNWTILLKCLKINHKVIFKCCMKYLDRKLPNCQNSHLFFKQTVYNWIVSIALFRHHLLKLCRLRQNFTMKWVNTSAHVERLVTSDGYIYSGMVYIHHHLPS